MEQKPLISVLIPARPILVDRLEASLQAIIKNTVDPSRVEILVKVDDDCPNGIDLCRFYNDKLSIKSFIMPGKWKRTGLMRYTNFLASKSVGDILWFLPERSNIDTYGWDEELNLNKEFFINRISMAYPIPGDCTDIAGQLAMVSRYWYTSIGKLTYHNAIDIFMNTICSNLPIDRVIKTKIKVIQKFERTLYPEAEEIVDELSCNIESKSFKSSITRSTNKLLKAINEGF